MALRDYSNGEGPLSGFINEINDNEARRQRSHEQNVRSMEQVGFAFIAGTLLQRFFERRRS